MTNYINFIRWAKENGAEFSDLTLKPPILTPIPVMLKTKSGPIPTS